MRIQTQVKAGGMNFNHNQTLVRMVEGMWVEPQPDPGPHGRRRRLQPQPDPRSEGELSPAGPLPT